MVLNRYLEYLIYVLINVQSVLCQLMYMERGIRQGDPISPFLFSIVVEALNLILERTKEEGLIRGVTVGANGVVMSHLQFADDTIIFCNNEVDEMLNIKKRLSIWERRYVSVGGRLTLVKSTLSSLPALSSEQCQKQLKRCKGSFYGEIPYHTEEKLHMVKWENMAKG